MHVVIRYDTEENEKLSRFIFNKNGDILIESDKAYNVIYRFTRGYEVVAADILDGNVDLGESQNLQPKSKYNRYFVSTGKQ